MSELSESRLIVFDLTWFLSYLSTAMDRLLASCFGLGRLPLAPGTWGSLPPAIVFALMWYFGAPTAVMSMLMAALALAGSVVCVKFAPAVIEATGKVDPPEVVADEFAGQAVTFVGVMFMAQTAVSAKQIWASAALGFFLFRLFDIVKPWPIRKLEKLPKGWGVLADDIVAGVCSAVVLVVCFRLWIAGFTG